MIPEVLLMVCRKLLEAHFEKLRAEGDDEHVNEEDEEKAWEGWEVDSESSDSDSEGWIAVSSDEEDIVISDSEDESEKKGKQKGEQAMDTEAPPTEAAQDAGPPRISTLATTKVSHSGRFHTRIIEHHFFRYLRLLTLRYSMI